ncbi:hypothetical protein MHU86_1830 [Fragilaria crotonensis]|nr:hypothetical protein MHU86_1830 [Fragilaria crotonensis]
MKSSLKLANKAWKEGEDADTFVVYPDDVSFHDARHLIGPVFGAHEPLTLWLMESFENGKDATLNACTMGFDIYKYLHAHGGTVLGKRSANGTLEAAAVLGVHNGGTRSCSCWNWVKEALNFTRALLSISWRTPGGFSRELYHTQFKRERRQFYRRVDLMHKCHVNCRKKVGLDGKYWYVALVAVHSEAQGKGLGRELMRRLGHVADQQQMACFLETYGDKNIRFYQSLGYEIACNIEIVDETVNSTMRGVAMIRQPRPKDQATV